MKKSKLLVSGFTHINHGKIINCYSDINIRNIKNANGFCNSNLGTISNSYSNCKIKLKNISDGFCKENNGEIISCFFNKENSEFDKKSPGVLPITSENFKEEYLQEFGWDTEKVWISKDNRRPNFKKRFFHIINDDKENFIKISSAEKLFDIAKKINEGNKEYSHGKFILTKNINLNGKKWIPIGKDESHPFFGKFDGDGFSVYNFVVSDKHLEYAGLFGVLKDSEIFNLTVDGIIKRGTCSGTLAGFNDNGLIACCSCACSITPQKISGGFVGKNNGVIAQCFTTGSIFQKFIIPFPIAAFLLTGAAAGIVIGSVYMYQQHKLKDTSIPAYPPVEISSDAKKVDDGLTPATGGNSVSYKLVKNVKANSGTGDAIINFLNPGSSNHNIVLQMQITDEELINKLGKTGRINTEQSSMEKASNYDAKTQRVTIGESGAVPPGYSLEQLKLHALPDGTVLPAGEYNAVVYMLFYDINSNERAILNSQVPIVLTIES